MAIDVSESRIVSEFVVVVPALTHPSIWGEKIWARKDLMDSRGKERKLLQSNQSYFCLTLCFTVRPVISFYFSRSQLCSCSSSSSSSLCRLQTIFFFPSLLRSDVFGVCVSRRRLRRSLSHSLLVVLFLSGETSHQLSNE